MGPIGSLESIFPLDHHAEVLVVEQQYLHRQLFTVQCCQFLDVHLKGTIAIDVDYQRARIGCLNSHGCWQAEPHRP